MPFQSTCASTSPYVNGVGTLEWENTFRNQNNTGCPNGHNDFSDLSLTWYLKSQLQGVTLLEPLITAAQRARFNCQSGSLGIQRRR